MAIHKGGYKKIRRTPEGGAGRDEIFCDIYDKILRSKTPGGKTLAAGPTQLDPKNHQIFRPPHTLDFVVPFLPKIEPLWFPRGTKKSQKSRKVPPWGALLTPFKNHLEI